MLNCNPCRTTAHTQAKLDDSGPPIADPTLYRSLARGLQYLTFTRLDMSFAIHHIYLYMYNPHETHFQDLKCILRYILGTLYLGH